MWWKWWSKGKKKEVSAEEVAPPPVQGPSGETVAVSTRRKPMPKLSTEECGPKHRSGERVSYACGHVDAASFSHGFYGEVFRLSDAYLAERKRCADCEFAALLAHTRRCCACGGVILPGQAVAAYADDGRFNPAWTTAIDGAGLMACMRSDCCESGGFFYGRWDGEKVVPAFEHGTAAMQTMVTGEPVVGDI